MIQFRRRQVGQSLIEELLIRAKSSQSSVLFGPRYSGKRHLARQHQYERLKQQREAVQAAGKVRPDKAHRTIVHGAAIPRAASKSFAVINSHIPVDQIGFSLPTQISTEAETTPYGCKARMAKGQRN